MAASAKQTWEEQLDSLAKQTWEEQLDSLAKQTLSGRQQASKIH
jgi:hypothetical protein